MESDSEDLPKKVLDSYWENRRLHEDRDEVKEKSLKFVHGEQYDPEVEEQRNFMGLPSLVADKTFSVWKILDGFSRNSRVDVKFIPVGTDDIEKAKLHNRIHVHVRNSTELHQHQAKAYGHSAICDEAYMMIHPEMNTMGQLDPNFHVFDPFECYPDANFKDSIEMADADFIDTPYFINPNRIRHDFKNNMSREFRDALDNFSPTQTLEVEKTGQQSMNRDGETVDQSNGAPLVVRRFYKKFVTKTFLVDTRSDFITELRGRDKREFKQADAEALGMEILKLDVEELWNCLLIPAVSQDFFVYNEPHDFQPINPAKLGKVRWPIIRFVFSEAGGRAIGAIRNILKLQEARNLILSALLHHIQTAANGGMLMENSVFNGDEIEEERFRTIRNRANYTGTVADNALKERRIAPVPRGETAFKDGGDFLENMLQDAIKDVSGAEPIMKGQAQKGSPAALFNLQIEQSQQQLLNSAELFRQSQNLVADLIYSFTRQFWNERRIIQIEGQTGREPEQLVLNDQSEEGEYLNDPTYGLFTVYKSHSAVTESSRRKDLADTLDTARALAEVGVPPFVQDFNGVIDNLRLTEEGKAAFRHNMEQWQKTQGILSEEALAQQQAATQQQQIANSQAQNAPQQVSIPT